MQTEIENKHLNESSTGGQHDGAGLQVPVMDASTSEPGEVYILMGGWIKLYRKISTHWVWTDANYFKAWITILFEVNHAHNKVMIKGELFNCERGQSLNSLNTWTRLFGTGWSIRKTRTFLNLLKNDSMICIENAHKTTRLTVCNYEKYNDNRQANDTQTTSQRHADDTQTTTNKNDKEDKEGKKDLRAPHVKFYSNQLKASEGQPEHPNYKTFVEFLYGRHPENSEKLERLLSVTKQVKYDEFVKLKKAIWKSNPLTLSDYILSLENYKAKVVLPYQSVYQTILTWIKRDQTKK